MDKPKQKKIKTITQEKLHGCNIIDYAEQARRVSLFPFFDDRGTVICHMMESLLGAA
ncbi:MAG: hypothetical protein QNK37_37190 [Acidobacteriota bacterium]|nr:hypothetical protein [Acidobacteriota bacterium]